MFAHIKKFASVLPPLKEVLSEDGVGSYSRYSGFVVILATICWITFLVIKNHAFPDMAGPASFMASGQASYVANQAKRVTAALKSGGVQAPNDPSTPTVTTSIPGDHNAN